MVAGTVSTTCVGREGTLCALHCSREHQQGLREMESEIERESERERVHEDAQI
jgi:hypothetical protein